MANPFLGISTATLQTHLDAYMAAQLAIATTGQSYSIEGRSLTRANLPEVQRTIQLLNNAIRLANGTTATRVIPDFS